MEPLNKVIKIVVMSDTHDCHYKIDIGKLPKADIFIHCGDFTKLSREKQLADFRNFLKLLPYKHKIVIAGNHDFVLDRKNYPYFQKTKHKDIDPPLNTQVEIAKLKQVCTYLEHQLVEVEGLRIFGSPYQPQFFDWGFMYTKGEEAQRIWSTIPQNIDVLITHGPPYGILDLTVRKQRAGCEGLLVMVEKIKPQIHLFGHIHEGYGMKEVNGIKFYNASNVNFGYKLVNDPFLIEITPKYADKQQKSSNQQKMPKLQVQKQKPEMEVLKPQVEKNIEQNFQKLQI